MLATRPQISEHVLLLFYRFSLVTIATANGSAPALQLCDHHLSSLTLLAELRLAALL